ncbi:hypothetical protein HYS29_00850 [Candidatus Microgenomates bacterium]|nr:hypothetical protein [Candidatus Microgenomates bacterium]MBI2622247.1 hypothetical protein [Candidatus Microgenomates bacterium]
MLQDLIISKTRVKLLNLYLQYPGKIYHVRELVRQIGEEINAVRRELAHLEKHGLVSKEIRGNRLYYEMRKDYFLYNDLLRLVAKTTGLGGEILKNRVKLGKIKFAMMSARAARGAKGEADDVDLLIVGTVVLPELALIVKNEEAKRGTELNYTVMTLEEFEFRKKRHDPFIQKIIYGSRLMLVGDEEELLK